MESTKKDESVILEVIVSEDSAKVAADSVLLESSFTLNLDKDKPSCI